MPIGAKIVHARPEQPRRDHAVWIRLLVALAALLVIVAGGSAAWWWWPSGQDPQVAKALDLQRQLMAGGFPPQGEPNRELFDQLRQHLDQLTPEQRDAVRQQGREMMRSRMNERLTSFFALPPAERTKRLDEDIDSMQRMFQRFASGERPPWAGRDGRGRRGEGGERNRGTGEGTPAGQTADGQRGPRGEAPGGPGGPGGFGDFGGRDGGRGRGGSSLDRRREMLDRSTPEERAMMSEYFRLMQQRRKERGLPDFPSRRGPAV